jgi:integrase
MAVYKPTYREKTKTGAKRRGKKKQSAVWWFNFTYAGKRVQESAKTTRRTVAVEAEKRRRLELERALAGLPSERATDRIRTVLEALRAYRKGYALAHRAKSVSWVSERTAHVERLLGGVLMPDLNEESIHEYMEKRRAEGAGNRTINMELGCLSRAIGHTWKALWPQVRKLEENQDIGKALEPEQEAAVLAVAARNRSRLIYPYLMTLCWTGMRSDEARQLRWSQVDFEAGQITVGRSKSEAGKGRRIPMSAALRFALERHVSWLASKLGPVQPDWYVFPRSNRTKPEDPTRPATSLKGAWEAVRETAGVNCRLHDLRHSFCTKMAEAGVPESTMLDMMGHVSVAMLKRYSHIRAQARREAISALETRAVSFEAAKVSAKVEPFGASKRSVTH